MNETVNTEKQEMDPYAKLLAIATGEIEALAGGERSHLRWFESQHPANADILSGFLSQIHLWAGHVPLSQFGTLLNLWVAMNAHIWCCWKHRNHANASSALPFGNPRAN